MNAQIPGYSAVYNSYPPSCQEAGGYTQPTMPAQTTVPGLASYQQGTVPSMQQGTQTMQPLGLTTLPITDTTQPAPMTTESTEYLNGYLRTQIGKRIRVEFLVGTNTYLEKSGKLLAVGANYIVLQEAMSDDLLVCDFYNIKFVTIYR